MYIKKEINFYDIYKFCNNDAKNVLEKVEDEGGEQLFMDLLEEIFSDGTPTAEEINIFLQSNVDHIYEYLGIEV